ncbi:hypothetical protein [Cognatishimia sp. MH4019]|uniref:hypothetical protein n=1 Tax=Cognatishimia sp. MH4019 TaxID=2854030 RepID=UPI001CD6156F|nr:hypothetical protein [Cognatishimia sp. MH4019]
MSKYGPSRGEAIFFLIFGLALIAFFIVGVIATLMMGTFNPAWVEVGLFGGGFAVFVIYRSLKALRNSPLPPED